MFVFWEKREKNEEKNFPHPQIFSPIFFFGYFSIGMRINFVSTRLLHGIGFYKDHTAFVYQEVPPPPPPPGLTEVEDASLLLVLSDTVAQAGKLFFFFLFFSSWSPSAFSLVFSFFTLLKKGGYREVG